MSVKRFRPVCQFLADGTPVATLCEFHEGYVSGEDYDTLKRERDDLLDRNSLLLSTNYDLRKERDSWMAEAEMNAEAANQSADYAARLAVTLELLRKHGIHVEEKWCWCEPTVEDHREGE